MQAASATIHYDMFGDVFGDTDASVAGASPAVVLAHGAGGNAISWWQQVPHFARQHRVVTFDHRGFGRSHCEPGAFRTSHFPDDLLRVLDAERIERAALVCQSMGGWTGLPTALRHPERVTCLVLCDTPGGLFTDEIARALAGAGERIRDAGIQANAALAPDYPRRQPEMAHLYARISALNTGVGPGALAALGAPEARIDPASLAGFRIPTLVVAGEHDLLFPAESLRRVAELIPGAAYREFAGCGHSVYFEDAPAFNRVVGEFVSKHG